jgi:trk system potassium uptake protein TrkH
MDRDYIEEDLYDHYSKQTLLIICTYLGFLKIENLNKSELISRVIDGFYNAKSFSKLYNKLSYEAKTVVNDLTWNGISTLKRVDSVHNIKICLEDFYMNTADPFIKHFKNYYTKEIQFSNGLRFLFKYNLSRDKLNLKSDNIEDKKIIKADNLILEQLDGIKEFISVNEIKERGLNKKILIKTVNKFNDSFNITNPIDRIRSEYILRFLQFLPSGDSSVSRVVNLFNSYKKGTLLEENIDQFLYYPSVKGINSNSSINIFLKRGRHNFIDKLKGLDGWIELKPFVRELSLNEDTEIFDTSYFGSLLYVKVNDELSREFSNKIPLLFKKDNEDFLLSPMLQGVMFFLYLSFRKLDIANPIFSSFFHSVSAFCNAGFSILDGGLIVFRNDTYTSVVFMLLIITGGMGFMVLQDIYFKITGRDPILLLHTKIMLISTIILIISGALFYYIFEYNSPTMEGLTWSEKILPSFFQSVTTRTAGFNTIDQSSLTMPSKAISLGYMLIGGGSGSTAGGLKVTTAFLIFCVLIQGLNNKKGVTFLNRKISSYQLTKAGIFFGKALVLVFLTIIGLTIAESKSGSSFSFMDITFESFSAIATVGLSVGITAKLSIVSKIILIFTMFAGRIGLFSLILPVNEIKFDRTIEYPEGEVLIG